MTSTILPPIERSIKFDRATKDYAVTVDGQFIGYARTYDEGEQLADEHVYDLLAHGLISDDPRTYAAVPTTVPDATPEMDTAVLPSAELVAESLRHLSNGATIHSDTTFQRACDKAALHLARGIYPQRSAGDWLIVGSTGSVYRVRTFTGDTLACNCQAGMHGRDCWHQALVFALVSATSAA